MDAETETLSAELADELLHATRHADTREVPVRQHHLKQMARSPAHCRFAMLSGHDEPNLVKRIGSGVHSLLLGGPELKVFPGKVRRGKDFDKFVVDNPGKLICSRSEYETANRTADAVRADRLASEILFAKGNRHEERIDWEWLGRSRRSTPDIAGDDLLAELKTTQNASMDKFKWDVLRYGYPGQLADYRNALLTTRGRAPRDVYIVAVEKKPPYVCSTFRVSKRDLEIGLAQCQSAMERLLICEASNQWPGYCSSIQDLELPGDDNSGFIFADEEDAA